ncbi:MAG: TIGR03960 family B12-binding radical SAM protein [Chloroflexota bacterium]
MDNLLADNTLLHVNRPARYTGGEWNSIRKDWDRTAIRIALSYPDLYDIGMSNAAIPILYDLLNRQPDVLAERVYAPWGDMEALLRARKIPLFSLESRRPLQDFDILGFSLGYELTYTNVLNMLDLAGIPVLAAQRDDTHPLVIAGGSCCLNPEPMADFIDAFVLGDGEEVLLEFLETFRHRKGEGKAAVLRHLAGIPGVYVPRFYQVTYQADGRVDKITPTTAGAKARIQRRMLTRLPPPVTSPVVPYIETTHDRGVIEIQRGCTCGCRFCQAGMLYRPLRERPQEEIVQAAGEIIRNCGYDEISLLSLNTSDYPDIDKLVTRLTHQYPKLTLSVPSLRFDTPAINLVTSLPTRSKPGLTFAPEAGSERLRQVINKTITEDNIIETASTVFARGWHSLKLYFMVGLPTETPEDVAAIARLVEKIRAAGRTSGGKIPQIRISVATFVPKPHTPFQWSAQDDEAQLALKHEILQQELPRKGVFLSWHDPKISLLEAALSRGDRRLGQVIYRAWQGGAAFDAWTERFNYDAWVSAFAGAGLEPAFYAHRERPLNEVLPWNHIDAGVSAAFLKAEYRRALKSQVTQDCHYYACNACGQQRRSPDCAQKLAGA